MQHSMRLPDIGRFRMRVPKNCAASAKEMVTAIATPRRDRQRSTFRTRTGSWRRPPRGPRYLWLMTTSVHDGRLSAKIYHRIRSYRTQIATSFRGRMEIVSGFQKRPTSIRTSQFTWVRIQTGQLQISRQSIQQDACLCRPIPQL